MKMDDIREIARQLGIKPGKLNKTQLVQSIQRQEGNFDCFASAANGECDQLGCNWREDCFATANPKPAAKKEVAKAKPKAKPKKKTVAKKKAVKKKKSAA